MRIIIDIPEETIMAVNHDKASLHDQVVIYHAIKHCDMSKNGKWIYLFNSEVNGLKVCQCNACNRRAYGSTDFCPNCGADMRGGD